MFRRLLTIILLAVAVTIVGPTWSYDVVVCVSGARASAAGTALRHIGFENVYIFKGGFKALAGYMGPKEANAPLKTSTEKK